MRDKLKHNESALRFYYKKRKELITYLGGKCVYCGTTENLEFDHINPNLKKFNISSIMTTKNKVDLEIKINNLQLLCHNCHLEKSKENGDLRRLGENNGASKLTKREVEEIRKSYKPRECSYNFLAKKYNVSKTTIIDIVKYKLWKD